jgi:hypothetical protein
MRVTRWCVVLWLLLAATAVNAASDDLLWRCAYDAAPGPRVACRLVHWPAVDPQVYEPGTVDDERTPILTRIRKAPETLADERIVIPLYGPPVDMRFVARLARAVMCGSRADCAVDFSSTPADD